MNRQTKRQMARQGADKPRAPERRSAPNPQVERTGPKQYFSEVRGEMKKVAWPPRSGDRELLARSCWSAWS